MSAATGKKDVHIAWEEDKTWKVTQADRFVVRKDIKVSKAH